LAFAPDGKLLASGDYQQVRLWDLAGDAPRETAPRAERAEEFDGACFAPGGKTLITTGNKGARLWGLGGDRPQERHAPPPAARRLVVAPDGKTMAAASDDVVVLWDVSGDRPREKARLKAQAHLTSGCSFLRTARRWSPAARKPCNSGTWAALSRRCA